MAVTKRKRRRRRILGALVAVFVLGIAAVFVSAHFLLNSDRVRRLAEAAVTEYTGIDLHIDRLYASLWSGRVVAAGIRLEVPDATASVERVAVQVRMDRLFAREIVITRGDIEGLVVRLPEDAGAIADIIDAVEQTVDEHRGGGDGPPIVTVQIDQIVAAAHVYFDTETEPFLSSGIRIDNLLTARIGIHADAALLAWGDVARVYGDIDLLRAEPGSPWQADGGAWIRGVETERLPLTNSPEGLFAADMTFMPTDPGPGADIQARLIVPSQPEITGASSVRGVWTGERFDIAELHWQSPSAQFEASGSYASLDDWRLSVREAHAAEVSLDALLALFEQPGARFEADPSALLALTSLEADSVGGDWHIAQGALDFNGITIVSQFNNPARQGIAQATRGLRGSASAADGTITVREIRSDDLHVAGALFPDRANKTLRVDLQGDANLANLPWTLLRERGEIEEIQGQLSITKFAGTFTNGDAPDDLAIEGVLRDARLKYRDDVLTVDAHNVGGTFSTSGKSVAVDVRAIEGTGAPVVLAGKYDVQARTWTGTLDADPSRLVPSLLASLDAADEIYSGTSALGPSVFDLTAEFPLKGREAFTLNVARRNPAEAALDGQLMYANDRLTLTARATVPSDHVLAEFLPKLRGEGPLHADFTYDQAQKRYAVTADATAVSLASDSVLQKAAGTPFTFTLNGATAKTWTVEFFEAKVHGTSALRTTGPIRHGEIPFEAQLAPMAAFLPEGASAGGTIRGKFRAEPFGGDFHIDSAAIALSPDVALDRIHGAIHITPDVFSCEALEVDGARSDATISLTRIDNRWSGAATGTKLDVEAIVELADAVRTLRPEFGAKDATAGAPRSFWTDPFIGEFTVSLNEFYYNRGQLESVAFRVLGEPRAIRVPEFSARTGEGSMLGSFVILPGDTTDAVLKSAVKWTALDGRAFSDLLFQDDRGFFGVIDGELTFDAPWGDYKTMLAGGNGSARWSARDGSLGNIGFAGKLLAVLRTTEIIMLRVPSLKDQGLAYKTWTGEAAMANGVMTLRDTQLDGGAYAIAGKGTVDFAAEQTNVQTFTRVLESVGKVVSRVPIIGDIATALSTDLVGVPVNFTGSPYDLKVDIAKATGKSVATAPLRAGEGALKAVGEGIKKLIPGGNKKEDTSATPP